VSRLERLDALDKALSRLSKDIDRVGRELWSVCAIDPIVPLHESETPFVYGWVCFECGVRGRLPESGPVCTHLAGGEKR
jgi:hypothetical protein